jgi:hypothetical protein
VLTDRVRRHDWHVGDPIRVAPTTELRDVRGRTGQVTRLDGPRGQIEVKIVSYVYVDVADVQPIE